MRIKIVLAYTGTQYSGWQIQAKPNPPKTIQNELEKALSTLSGKKIKTYASGRTDAGVHALYQVIHCDVPENRNPLSWLGKLNSILPYDIRVMNLEETNSSFHARKDAINKTYMYQFWQERHFAPPQILPFVWNCGKLDIKKIRKALPYFIGEHDFSSLQNTGTDLETTIRTIYEIKIKTIKQLEFCPKHLPLVRLIVTANGFLKQMVRNIAGLLVYIGQDKLQIKDVPNLLNMKNRKSLPSMTAPASGLFLINVNYKE